MYSPLEPRQPAQPLPGRVPPGYTVGYDHRGMPVYVPQPQPQQVVVQVPDAGLSRQQRELVITVMLILAVIVVCTGAVCAVLVIAGGTLMGIIGATSAAAVPVGMTAVGVLLAAAWLVSKLKTGKKGS